MVSWHRYFCSLCGAMTTRPPEPGEYARCAAHAHLPNERDLIPPDPRETIPTMRQELSEVRHADQEARAIRGGGVQGTRAVPPPDAVRCYVDGCDDPAAENLRLHMPGQDPREVLSCARHAAILREIAL